MVMLPVDLSVNIEERNKWWTTGRGTEVPSSIAR